jgi:hypothetical protein
VHAETFAVLSHVPFPPEGRPFFDRHPGFDRGRKDAIAVRLVFGFKQPPAGHADNTSLDSFTGKLLVGLDTQCDLASGSEQEDVGIAIRRSARIYAPRERPLAAAYFARSKVGKACRVRISATGVWRCFMMTFQASTTTLPLSHG